MPLGPEYNNDGKRSWKKLMTVIAPICAGPGNGSFENYISRALNEGYQIYGEIYVEDRDDGKWAIAFIIKS